MFWVKCPHSSKKLIFFSLIAVVVFFHTCQGETKSSGMIRKMGESMILMHMNDDFDIENLDLPFFFLYFILGLHP